MHDSASEEELVRASVCAPKCEIACAARKIPNARMFLGEDPLVLRRRAKCQWVLGSCRRLLALFITLHRLPSLQKAARVLPSALQRSASAHQRLLALEAVSLKAH